MLLHKNSTTYVYNSFVTGYADSSLFYRIIIDVLHYQGIHVLLGIAYLHIRAIKYVGIYLILEVYIKNCG